jgi:hypothetical protein
MRTLFLHIYSADLQKENDVPDFFDFLSSLSVTKPKTIMSVLNEVCAPHLAQHQHQKNNYTYTV